MTSTVTTSTVTTVTTATATAGTLGVSLSLIAIVALCVFLIKKEIISSSQASWAQTMSQALNLVIIPLFMAFVMIASFKLYEVLN